MDKQRLMELAGVQLNEAANFSKEELAAIKDAIVFTFNAAMDSGEDEHAPTLQSAYKKLFGKELEY